MMEAQSGESAIYQERRRGQRLAGPKARSIESIWLRPGHKIQILNLSSAGACFETAKRLLPGTPADLHIGTERGRRTIRGAVVRCEVASVSATSISYRAAIQFEHEFTLTESEAHQPGVLVPVSILAHLRPIRMG